MVIIPTYNEFENIGPLITRLLEVGTGYDILVVDDSSPDGTDRIVKQLQRADDRIHLLSRPKKQGLAAAYKAGFKHSFDRGYLQIVQMDADFSHNPMDVPLLLKDLESYDVVFGSRYTPGGSISGWGPTRQLVSRCGNLYAKTILRTTFRDLTGGFVAWKREVLEKIKYSTVRSVGYSFQVELKYRAFRNGFKIYEHPIHFENRKYGKSKMTGGIVWEAALRVFEMKTSKLGIEPHAEPR